MKDKLRELADRLDVLAHAVTEANWREFSMRVPVEPERDADCVLSQAAIELRSYAAILDASDTQPNSPDAADSVRVTDAMVYRFHQANRAKCVEIGSQEPMSTEAIRAGLIAALAAQGHGDRDALTVQRDEWGQRLHPSPFARVPDGNAKWIAKAVPLLKAAVSWMPTKKCAMHIREIDALLRATPPASPAGVPDGCDGKEQDAFEAWAKDDGFDMERHPLHWLFLNQRTYAARQGWKGALEYVNKQIAAAPSAPEGGEVGRG